MSNLKRFFTRWQNWIALIIIGSFILIGIFAPVLAPPLEGESASIFREVDDLKGQIPFPPGESTILGTVPTGIRGSQLDVYYTLVWGTRSALRFGLLAALGTAILGVLLGAMSAYIGGWLDNLIMRITDAFLAFPVIVGVVVFQELLQIANQAENFQVFYQIDPNILETPGKSMLQILFEQIDPVLMAIVLFSWMPYARLTHSMVYQVKKTEFIEAARALGSGHWRLLFRHLIPNSISPAIVLGARDIGGMVLLQATFTFIGLGGGSEWGQLLSIGRRWVIGIGGSLTLYWWVFAPITLALILFGIGWSLLGDGVNDWLNPHIN